MPSLLAEGGLFTLLVIGGLAWGFARVLDAPRWAGRAILLVLVLAAAGSQLLLPPGAAFRESVGGGLRALLVLGIVAIPVLAYRFVLRRLRARAAPAKGSSGTVVDRVALIPAPQGLEADLAARLGIAPARFGLVHRDAGGALVAGAVARVETGLARIAPVWWAEAVPGAVTGPLIEALGSETAGRGARVAVVETRAEHIAEAFRAAGYRPSEQIEAGGARQYRLTKEVA